MTQQLMTEVKVGDHLCSVWGYDETRVTFYEVVGVTATGKSLRLKQAGKQVVSNWGTQQSVVPGEVLPNAPVKTVRTKASTGLMVSQYQYATVWGGEPVSEDGPGWGR